MSNEFNDSLDDLLGGAPRNTPSRAPETFVPVTERMFTEKCASCRGTGRFVSWGGRDCGPCFKCKGQGSKTFRNSAESRAKARTQRAERKVSQKQAEVQAWIDANKAEHAWLVKAAAQNATRRGTFGFPQAMLDAVTQWGSLTERQLAKVQELMIRDANRVAQPKPQAVEIDCGKIEAAFDKARAAAAEGDDWIRNLALRFDGFKFAAGQGKHAGKIWVNSTTQKNSEGRGLLLGVVEGGKLQPRREATSEQIQAIVAVAKDPGAAAKAFGLKFKFCCCCGRELTNQVSRENGIGPICAERFGF